MSARECAFIVCRDGKGQLSRIGCLPGKAGVQDAELEAVGEALERTEVVADD